MARHAPSKADACVNATFKVAFPLFSAKLHGVNWAYPEAFLSVTLISVTEDWACLGMEQTNSYMNTNRSSPTRFLPATGNTPLFTWLCASCAYVGLDSPRCEFITFSCSRAWKGRAHSRPTVFSSEPPPESNRQCGFSSTSIPRRKASTFMWLEIPSLEELTSRNENHIEL